MNPKILLIDDEPEIRDLYRSFLEMENYEIFEAENGQQAFKMASEEHFDLYMTDIMMPEMNGVEFMKVLKMIDPDAIVIIVTGFDDMEYTRQALDYGAFRFLTKPINMKEFLSIVELGIEERKKLANTSSAERFKRLKEKLNSNPELKQKVYTKFEKFLLEMEVKKPTYIELGGPGSKGMVWMKIRNKFMPIKDTKNFKQDEVDIMILSALSENEMSILQRERHLRFNHEFISEGQIYRYHMNVFYECEKMVLGIKPTRRSILSLDKQRLSSGILDKISCKNENSGLVVFSGPSGAGKSCLIDAIVDYNNRNINGSIYIIADSIEYFHDSINCVIRHQELNNDVNDIIGAIDECMHLSPNLVVIEDIGNLEILEAALRLVDSGSMVYATLKNKSTSNAVAKLINLAPSVGNEQIRRHLSSSLKAVISQQLIQAVNGEPIPIKEILVNNTQISSSIINNNIGEIYQILLQGRAWGMQSLEQDLFNLLRHNAIKPEDAIEYANNETQIKDMLKYR
jgi:Tfp pilus assembly pilus retraction ATPase PilT/DNA-binding NarL/FixJ family response regulator